MNLELFIEYVQSKNKSVTKEGAAEIYRWMTSSKVFNKVDEEAKE